MNTNWRRGILWALNALGAFVGVWALAAPRSFYDAFPMPGVFGAWVAGDGPYNEHLVRDVGSLYLALVAAGVVAALMRRADASVAVGVAWLVFSVPHLAYHAEDSLFSGDVLFSGSVGRTDLPGADWETLLASIRTLADRFPPETVVYSGHGPPTTLGAELDRNPFLTELRAS